MTKTNAQLGKKNTKATYFDDTIIDWKALTFRSQEKSLRELLQSTSGLPFQSDNDPTLCAISKKFNRCMQQISPKNGFSVSLSVEEVLNIVSEWYPKKDLLNLVTRWAKKKPSHFNTDSISTVTAIAKQVGPSVDCLQLFRTKTLSISTTTGSRTSGPFGISFSFVTAPHLAHTEEAKKVAQSVIGVNATLAFVENSLLESAGTFGKSGMREKIG